MSRLGREAGPNQDMRLVGDGSDKFEHFELPPSQTLQGLLPIVTPRTHMSSAAVPLRDEAAVAEA